MADPISLDGMSSDERQELKEAVCDAVLERTRRVVYHRSFSDAVTRARAARTNALEGKLLRSRKGAETTAAIFALKNAAPDEWRDVKYQEHQHTHAIRELTDAQLLAIAAGQVDIADDGMTIDHEPQQANER